jgi:hypothetical protein
MTRGERRGHVPRPRPDGIEENSKASGLPSRRRPRPHSSLNQRRPTSLEENHVEKQQNHAKYVKRLSVQAISDISFTRPVPRKKLLVRPNKVKHLRVVASALLRSWLSHSKGVYRRSVRPRKKAKKSKEDRPAISAPGALDWVTRPIRSPPINHELCPAKLGGLEEALHSNPYVPERLTRPQTRLRVVNDTENRRRGTVFSDDFLVERETTEGRAELEGSAPLPNSHLMAEFGFRRQASSGSRYVPPPIAAQRWNVAESMDPSAGAPEPHSTTPRMHGKMRRGAIAGLVGPFLEDEEPEDSTRPLNTSYMNALRRQSTQGARNHLSGADQQPKFDDFSDLRADTAARIDASVARLVTRLPPSHRIASVQGDPEVPSQAHLAQPAYSGHSPLLQYDLEILERGIRQLLDERVVGPSHGENCRAQRAHDEVYGEEISLAGT